MGLSRLDELLFVFINQNLHLDILDPIMVFVTERPYIAVVPFLLLMSIREKKNIIPALAVGAAALVLSDLAADSLKEIIQRPRPCDVLGEIRLLVACPESFSMPSGHATDIFAFTVPLYFFTRDRLRHALLAVAVLVALSRLYAGVHYPSDVLSGAALGSALGALMSITFIRATKRHIPR